MRLEVRHALRLLRSEVVQFQRVVRHVVEMEGRLAVPSYFAGAERLDQFPILRPGGKGAISLGSVTAVPLEEKRAIGPPGRLTSQQRREAQAVELHLPRLCHSAEIQQRRGQIDDCGNAIDATAGLELRGPADEAELVNAALERRALPTLKTGIITVVLLAPVVGKEDHDRVFRQFPLFELGQQAAHVVVDVLNHAVDARKIVGVARPGHGVPLLWESVGAEVFSRVVAAILLRHLVRRVRAVEGQVNEERPIALGSQELEGRVGEHVADVAAGLHPRAIVAERGVEIGSPFVHRIRRITGLSQAAAVEDQRFLKPLVHSPHRIIVAEVPLAEDAGAIARGGEHLRQGGLVRVHERPAQVSVRDAGPVVVSSRHQAGSRGRADRHDVKVHQPSALAGQPVHVGRANERIAGCAELAKALVVGKY